MPKTSLSVIIVATLAAFVPPGPGHAQGSGQAQAIGGRAAGRTWHAYLSQEQRGTTPRINARDRIASGPWFNVKGQLIASTLADLHGDQAGTRDRNNLQKATVLDAKGNEIPGVHQPNFVGSDLYLGVGIEQQPLTRSHTFPCGSVAA
jgi:hypothetical protein